jgi:hypothetical protein
MTHQKVSLIRRVGPALKTHGEWSLSICPAAPEYDGPVTGCLAQNGPTENDLQYLRGVFVNIESAIHEVAEYTKSRVWKVTDPIFVSGPAYHITKNDQPPRGNHKHCIVEMVGGKFAKGGMVAHE